MKVVLSRKGFDASSGGAASPILPDGTLLSLPIPSASSPLTYNEVRLADDVVGPLVMDLTQGRVRGCAGAHLDPDLRESALDRSPGWRPLFGQDGTAQAHLRNSGVGVGDLFLFFGWFRQAERRAQGHHFATGAPDLHVVFGWLQIAEIVPVDQRRAEIPPWGEYHPHFQRDAGDDNTVYVAQDELALPGMPRGLPGGGAMERYSERLRLTAPGRTRSWWRLPKWFYPENGRPPLTYHRNLDRWTMNPDHVIVRSAPRGQEFVLDADWCPEVVAWAFRLIAGTV